MINFRSALGAKFTIAVVVISLFALLGCEMQDLGITESAASPRGEVSLSVSSQSPIPANPPAWDANTLYNKAGLYVTHKGKVWVSQWSITKGAEPGKNSWNGWKIAETASRDKANPKPWNADVTYGGKGYYVTHKGSTWVSKWSITRGAEPGVNTWNGWKQVSAPPKWVSVSIEYSRSFAINEKGELYAWGANNGGSLGDGTTTNRHTPTRIGTASDWKAVAAARRHTLALNTKGELYSWGYNGSGRLGNGTTTNTYQDTPTRIGTASDWTHIAAATSHNLAINSKGELYSWGDNLYGKLGLGDGVKTAPNRPTRIGKASNWTHIAAKRNHNLAINSKGELYSWGRNYYGSLGDGTSTDRNTPTRIGTASDWRSISVGNSASMAINSKGELYTWGYNSGGQLGDGTTTNRNEPTTASSAMGWKSVFAGSHHSLAVRNNGELHAWGRNSSGYLGDGTTTDRKNPTRVGTDSNWKSASGGQSYSMAVNTKGELYAWGYNYHGQLGDGSTTNRLSPVKIAHP